MQIRDRIKELKRVKASELLPNPKNWRTHPVEQQDALKGVLAEIGYADALIARETDDGLMLIDGHLRAEATPDSNVPVLILDVTEAEADKMLLTLDPLAAMAVSDDKKLSALLDTVSSENEAVNSLLNTLSNNNLLPLMLDDMTIPPPDEESGTLLKLLDITVAEPRHQVDTGDIFQLGALHILVCASVIKDWNIWSRYLEGDTLFCPHPNSMVPLSEAGQEKRLLLVQPDTYIAGHILDRYEEIHGAEVIEKVN
tara:strand:- start:409 stop:1173 length:765 start_codon:yes stop_codon:yes gene_type:complete